MTILRNPPVRSLALGLAYFVTTAAAPTAPIDDRIVVTGDRSESQASVAVGPVSADIDSAAPADRAITIVRVRLKSDGNFMDCTIATSSGFPALDEQACSIAQKVHTKPPFVPPKDGKVYVKNRYRGSRDFLQNVVWRVGD
jgi:TonB family protein